MKKPKIKTTHPVAWHEECLVNVTYFYQTKLAEAQRLNAEVIRLEEKLRQMSLQIATAKDQGLAEFDAEKFLVPKAKKS